MRPGRSRRRLRTLLRRLHASDSGVAAVELALLAPVLIAFLLGVLDVGWRLVAEYKLTRAASSLAELVARARELREADVEDAFRATLEIASPFDLDANGLAVVSSVRDDTGTTPVVLWQRRNPPQAGGTSRVGLPDGPADLGDLDLEAGESVIVAEISYTFEPLVGFVFSRPTELYYRWIAAPRYGALTEVLP